MFRFVTAVCLLCFAPMTFSETLPVPEIDRFLKSEMQERHIPGLQLAVVLNGKIVLSRSYGTADLANDVPVTENSVFSINSATKSFTGVAVMQLVEAGKVALDAPVSRYVDGLPDAWRQVTITQLLNHTSGLPDIVDQRKSSQAVTDDDAAAWAAVQLRPTESAPGVRFSYNQTNYLLLGKVIDKFAAMPFTDFIRQRQFITAGMTNTAFGGQLPSRPSPCSCLAMGWARSPASF